MIGNLKNLAISPDGRHVYAPSYSWGIVSIFARDRGTGRLRYVGCVGDQRRGCARPAPLMLGPRGIAVLRDGRTVVVAAQDANAAIGFDRDPVTGWLTQSSCVAGSGAVRPPAGCSAGVAISSPENVAVGSDADEVIVSSTGISSLVRLRRDAATGTLRVVDAGAPCVTDRTDAATALCRSHPGLSSTYGVALSPDGQQVYSASYTPGAVGAFTVDPRSRELVGVGPCFSSTDTACTRRAGLARAGVIAIAPDARHIYVAAPDSSTVTAFARRMVVRPVALVRGRPRITRQGGVDVNVACPPTMVGWCVGTATGRVVGRRGVRIASRAAQVIVPPGTTRRVRLAFPRAIRALGGRVRIEVRATMREPFGATARSQARIVVRR